MSEENVELARKMFATTASAINLGGGDDYTGVIDPEVEWIPINAALEELGITDTGASDVGPKT